MTLKPYNVFLMQFRNAGKNKSLAAIVLSISTISKYR